MTASDDQRWKWGDLVSRMRKKIADAPDGSLLKQSIFVEDFHSFAARSDRLTVQERELLIDQAILLLEQSYAHLPLKEAMHAVAPIQRLKVLREQHGDRDDLSFHRELREVFTSVRDLHTNYYLPEPYKGRTAYLPFTIREYFALGPGRHSLNEWAWRYVVSSVQTGFVDDTPGRAPEDRFGVGSQIMYWNGIPIERVIERLAEQMAGGNPESRRARAVDALTLRPLERSLPPDEDWVNIRYRTVPMEREPEFGKPPAKELEFEHMWFVHEPAHARKAREEAMESTTTGLGLDEEGDARTRARVAVFAPHILEAEKKVARWPGTPFLDTPGQEGEDQPIDCGDDRRFPVLEFTPDRVPLPEGGKTAEECGDQPLLTILPRFFRARRVTTEHGTYGYIRIFTFDIKHPNLLVSEFVRLVAQLPQNGLILDLRDNSGGNIHAGERLLQTLTPRTIEPQRLQFINTPLVRTLVRYNSPSRKYPVDLSPWKESVDQSVRTGATYSRGFPITTPESCNLIGQKYQGPVVLVTNGRCYSTTDFFIAGFKDHEIGPILGTHVNTGAGGANVWEQRMLRAFMEAAPGENPFKALPRGARMRVAIRRSLRVSKHAGTPLEDLGVEPDIPHTLTYDDVMNGGKDILYYAGMALNELPGYFLRVEATHRPEGKLTARIWFFGTQVDSSVFGDLDRLDVFVDDRPRGSFDDFEGSPFEVTVDAPELPSVVDLKGYHEGKLVAARRVRQAELWSE